MTRAMWAPQIDRLRGRFRCLSLDLPGHGGRAGRPFSVEAASDAVARAVDEVGGGPAVIIGLSLGGYVAMTVASRTPQRVRGLVLAGATREPSGPTRLIFVGFGWALGLLPEWFMEALQRSLFRRRYGTALTDAILANGYFARGGSIAVRSLPGGRFRERLAAYGGPVLVVNGDLDRLFRGGERQFLEGIPNVRRELLRHASHLSNLDRPDEFTAAIERFLESLED